MDKLNIQTLRFVLAVNQTGSFSRAAREMYVTHSSVSRAVRELEQDIGITLFTRTGKGVEPTAAGTEFIRQARLLLENIDNLESRYFERRQILSDRLLVASQRYTAVGNAFIRYIKEYGGPEYMNFALLEGNPEQVLRHLTEQTCNIGVLHYTTDREALFFETLENLNLEWSLLEASPISIQIRRGHPLSLLPGVTVDMLDDYPHIVYADEDATHIKYCSDISRFDRDTDKKRIVIQDRGTMRQMVNNTDGYYIGVDASRMSFYSETDPVYIHLDDITFTLNTVWVKRRGYALTDAEARFVAILQDYLK